MEFADFLVIVVSLMRAVAWFVGACIVFHYGRKVPRLIRPTWFLAPAMWIAAFNSLIFTLTLNQVDIIQVPRWIEIVSQLLATPVLLVIVASICYPWINAVVLQRNEERLVTRAKDDAADFVRGLDKRD